MTREALIDIIRDELRRQAKETKVSVVEAQTPDSFMIIGVIDVHKLAETILGHL